MKINDATRVRIIRAMLGVDSKTFAKQLNVCAATLTSWEKGRSSPQGANKDALAEICLDAGIGFSPTGYPMPMADVMTFKSRESE
jgi:DNA-binding XRE family transcriptional regulator